MSFFGAGFDPRDDSLGVLTLVDVDTPDGDFGFMPGIDGKFTDTTGKVWWGSVLIDQPALDLPLNGAAPAGQIAMTFFQDPDMPDVVAQIAALGSAYVRGRPLSFYVQALESQAAFYAPTRAPVLLARYDMRTISFEASGPMQRRMVLSYEGVFAGRNEARGYFYTTTDHEKLIGVANPSLSRMPTTLRREEKLF